MGLLGVGGRRIVTRGGLYGGYIRSAGVRGCGGIDQFFFKMGSYRILLPELLY